MARSHVPKFGDWDNDNLPYTTYFENARKEKTGIRMNPNDPEENPEAFMHMKGVLESNSADKHHQNAANRNASYDHQNSAARRQRNRKPESGSENSNSDRSILHSNHRRANSGQKKGRAGRSSLSASVSGQSQRSVNYQVGGHNHHRTASIPKFGEWDETDPTSGVGFTAIFNQVKEEKQTPSSHFPTVPPNPSNYSDSHHSKRPSPSWCSKICCCLFSRGGD